MDSKLRYVIIALISIAVILAVIFLIKGISSIAGKNSQSQKTNTKIVPVTSLTVDPVNINKDPLVYDGLTVDINSTVSDWVTKKIFALNAGTNTFFGGSAGQLIVISSKEFPLHRKSDEKGLGLGETVNVHVRGRVRIVSRAELSRITGIDLDGKDIQLDDNSISGWTEGPVIILDSVEKL